MTEVPSGRPCSSCAYTNVHIRTEPCLSCFFSKPQFSKWTAKAPGNTPSPEDLIKLWDHCRKFVDDHTIGCEETIFQSDSVAVDSPEFIDGVCQIVGYCKQGVSDGFSSARRRTASS